MSRQDMSAKAIAVASQDESQRRKLYRIVAVFLFGAAMCFMTARAFGQAPPQYESIELPAAYDVPKNVKTMERAASGLVGYRGDLADYKDFRAAQLYFSTYIPAKMTHADAIGDMSKLVQNNMNQLVRAQRTGVPGAMQILKWTYDGMSKVAKGNYHPPARINAALVLGRLDRTPGNSQRPPTPLSPCLPILLELYKDNTAVDGVRAAALTGIRRHVLYSFPTIAQATKDEIAKEMTDLLSADPPKNRSEGAHAFLQRYAIDILNTLKPNDAALGAQLVSISVEPENNELLALHSAASIGKMSSAIAGKVQEPNNVLAVWSGRALRAFQEDIARLKSLEPVKPAQSQPKKPESFFQRKEEATAKRSMAMGDGSGEDMDMSMMEREGAGGPEMEMMGMMGMMGMRGAASAKPQPAEVVASRKRLNFVLQQLNQGVTGEQTPGIPRQPGGLLAAAPNQKAVIEKWAKSVESVVEGLNDPTHDDRKKYIKALEEQTELLREMAGEAGKKLELPDPLEAHLSRLEGEPVDMSAVKKPEVPVIDESGAPQIPAIDELAPEGL